MSEEFYESENVESENDEIVSIRTKSTPVSSIYIAQVPKVSLARDGFGILRHPTTGHLQGIVRRYTWSNANGVLVQVIDYGATIVSIKTPDKYGVLEDIVLGFDTLEDYMSNKNPYFGAAIGRVANRIGKSLLNIDNQEYKLDANAGNDHLHGGFKGFDKVLWRSQIVGNKVVMTHLSKNNSGGYPGNLLATVTFELKPNDEFSINFQATCDQPTPINLTNHSYFNLAGHGAGFKELYAHLVTLNSDKYTGVDVNSVPTGKFKFVEGTAYDFRVPRGLGVMLKHVPGGGFNINYCVNKASMQTMRFVARALHPQSGRILEVYSDQPGVQFHTANEMPNPGHQIIPFDVYEDPLVLQAVVYQTENPRDCVMDQEQFFMLDDEFEALEFQDDAKKNDVKAVEDDLISGEASVKDRDESVEDEGFVEDTVVDEEEDQTIEDEEIANDSIVSSPAEEKITPIKDSDKQEHICCQPECFCTFDMECDKSEPAASETPVKADVASNAESDNEETKNVLDTKSATTSEENETVDEIIGSPKPSAQSISIAQSSPVQESVHEVSKKSTESSDSTTDMRQSITEVVPEPPKIYKNCDEHDVDIIEMEMPTYGPTTKNVLGIYKDEIRGKMGARYRRHGALSFQTQNYPDAMNHTNFPGCILNPGEIYRHKIIYKFRVQSIFDKKIYCNVFQQT